MSGDDVVGAHTSVANGVCYSPSAEQTAERELNPFPHPIFIRAGGIALDDARLAVEDNLVDCGSVVAVHFSGVDVDDANAMTIREKSPVTTTVRAKAPQIGAKIHHQDQGKMPQSLRIRKARKVATTTRPKVRSTHFAFCSFIAVGIEGLEFERRHE